MPPAARQTDMAVPPGTIASGAPNVLIRGLPAARVGDVFTCALPPTAGPHPPNSIAKGSSSVMIGGQPAARSGDLTACGATIIGGAFDVMIGG